MIFSIHFHVLVRRVILDYYVKPILTNAPPIPVKIRARVTILLTRLVVLARPVIQERYVKPTLTNVHRIHVIMHMDPVSIR